MEEDPMFCSVCGHPLESGAAFCSNCGSPVPFPSSESSSSSYDYGPALKLDTRRGLWKLVLFSLLTFGIYGIVVWSKVSTDINVIASKHDGKWTTHYCLLIFLLSWLTLGIAALVWNHRLCERIGHELCGRRISYSISPGTFWGWGFFGTLILVGPFIYAHKVLKAMNLLSADYNCRG